MSTFYHDLDVEGVLQCPVCFELPSNEIFSCKVGHHMCQKCRKRLTTCPTCQSALTKTRNFVAEELISKFSIFSVREDEDPPNNNNLPANEKTTMPAVLNENKTYLNALPLAAGAYKCLLESCRNRKELGVGKMFSHLVGVHAHLFEKMQNKTATFTHNFENFCWLKNKRKYHRAFHVSNMGLFFLNLAVLEDNYINFWLTIPAPIKKANEFDYSSEFSREDQSSKLTYLGKVASNTQPIQWLLQRGRVFVIPPTSHMLKEGEFFSLKIKIVYRAPPPE